jgi:hypothetical protein
MALAVLIAQSGSLYVTSHARTPAAASAPSAQRAPDARPVPAYVVRFACVVRSGKAARHPLVVPAQMIGTTAACPALPAPCHARPGHPWPGQNLGTVFRVAVKAGQCILTYQGDKPAAPGR